VSRVIRHDLKLRVGDLTTTAKGFDHVGRHIRTLGYRRVCRHAIGTTVQTVVGHQDDLALGLAQMGFTWLAPPAARATIQGQM